MTTSSFSDMLFSPEVMGTFLVQEMSEPNSTTPSETLVNLVRSGAALDKRDASGRSALILAAGNIYGRVGYEDIFDAIMTRHPPLEERDNCGDTALLAATMQGKSGSVARTLVAAGADVCAKSNFNSTPLMWAAFQGWADIAKLLIRKGAKLESKDNMGRTALMEAAKNGHLEAVKLLVEKGARLHAKTDDGKTALDMARERPLVNEDVAAFLEEKSAEARRKASRAAKARRGAKKSFEEALKKGLPLTRDIKPSAPIRLKPKS